MAPKLIRRASKFQSTLPLRGATADCSLLRAFGQFQSTLPLRGATRAAHDAYAALCISIHAPLTGSDPRGGDDHCRQCHFNPRSPYGERQVQLRLTYLQEDFNPRSPYGERLDGHNWPNLALIFQSTLPLRGATWKWQETQLDYGISIHAPLTGSDNSL